MALHRVQRVGGPSDPNNHRFDLPTVVIDSFGADRSDATTAAITVDDALHEQLRGATAGGATITRIETVTGPHWAPWDDTAVRRMSATYRLHIKRTPPTDYAGVEALLVAWLQDALHVRVVTDVPADLTAALSTP